MDPNPSRQRSPSGRCSRIIECARRFGCRILALARVRRWERSCRRHPLARSSIVRRNMSVRRIHNDGCPICPSTTVYAEP